MSSLFLTPEELVTLTSKKRVSHQIQALNSMGIPFFVNASGRPIVVTENVVTGRTNGSDEANQWKPNLKKNK